MNDPFTTPAHTSLSWQLEKVLVSCTMGDAERAYAGPSAEAKVAWELRRQITQQFTDLIGSLYVGKRHVKSRTEKVAHLQYEGHVTGLSYAPSPSTYGWSHTYFQLMACALGLGLGMFAGTAPAFLFGLAAVALVGFGLPMDSPPALVPKLIPYSGTVTAPTTYIEEWYIDPTLQGNKTFDGLPLANSYTRVVFDGFDVYCDPLARYDAYTAAQE